MSAQCDEGLLDYDDGCFVGQYQLWGECGEVGAVGVAILSPTRPRATPALVVGVQLLTDADFDALDTIMATFDLIN